MTTEWNKAPLSIEAYTDGGGTALGRWYRKVNGKKQYLSDFELWLNEDLLGQPYSGLYKEDDPDCLHPNCDEDDGAMSE